MINSIHNSLRILVRLKLKDLVSNQEELFLLKTLRNFILDLTLRNKIIIKENYNSELTYFYSKN